MKLVLFILIIWTDCLLAQKVLDVADLKVDKTPLGPYMDYLIETDTHPEVASQDIFRPVENETLSLKDLISKKRPKVKHLWLRLKVRNTTEETKSLYIVDENFRNSRTDFYRGTVLLQSLGLKGEHPTRYLSARVPPHADMTFYIHYVNPKTRNSVPSISMDKQAFFEWDKARTVSSSVCLAVIVMSLLANILIFTIHRSRQYFYYLMYLLSFGGWVLYLATMPNLVSEFVRLDLLFLASLGLFAVLFSIEFLELKRYKKIYAFSLLCGFANVVNIVAALVLPDFAFRIMELIGIVSAPSFLFIGAYVYFRTKAMHSLIYCFAYGCFILGVVLNVLSNHEILEHQLFKDGLLFGTTLESTLMLIAIGQQIYRLNNDRKHMHSQLEKLVYPHQLNRIQEGKSLEQTMPVGMGQACVLAFDVIASSQIKDSNFVKAWEAFLQNARTMLMDSYDGDHLVSLGYMIKEMGDGFLCSVGYPFEYPSETREYCAINLAERLMSAFHSHMQSLQSGEAIDCSIGIATGSVEAYFSGSGAIRHDLWGNSVVLATRYEQFRSSLLPKITDQKASIICIQDKVFDKLPANIKENYRCYQLDELGIKVRNDPQAEFVAVKLWQGFPKIKSPMAS